MLSQMISQTGITFLWKFSNRILQYSGRNSSADLGYPLFKYQLRNWGVSWLSHVLSSSRVPPLCFKCILLHPSTNHPTTGHYTVCATDSVVKSTSKILKEEKMHNIYTPNYHISFACFLWVMVVWNRNWERSFFTVVNICITRWILRWL